LTIRSGFGYITVPSSQRSLKRFCQNNRRGLDFSRKT